VKINKYGQVEADPKEITSTLTSIATTLQINIDTQELQQVQTIQDATDIIISKQPTLDNLTIRDLITTTLTNTEQQGFKNYILSLLIDKERNQATEELTNKFLQQNYVYTTRDDDNSEMWIYRQGIYIPQGKTYIKEYVNQILDTNYTTTLCNQVIDKVEVRTYIDQKQLFNEENPYKIAVQNGILNLVTYKLETFTPNERYFNKIPVTYKPGTQCPNIQKHFQEVLKFEKDIPVIQELIGYCLVKDHFIEKAVMCIGEGRNGKSKTLDLLRRFLGAENCANIDPQKLEDDPWSKGELFNKLVNLGADISSTSLKETGTLKGLTGRDMISANRKYKTMVHFVNYSKQIFCANTLPKTYDTTTAFFNRWILIEFPYTFMAGREYEESTNHLVKLADPDIVSKLTSEEEMSGLLNWAIEGLKRLVSKGDFSYSYNTTEVKNIWIRKSDSFTSFLMDSVMEDWDNYVTKTDLRRKYSNYCRKHRLKSQSDKVIKITLSDLFGVSDELKFVDDGSRQHVWVGIRFK